jgi:hypothetical protein
MAEQRQLIYQVLLDLGNSPEAAKKAATEIEKIADAANRASKSQENLGDKTRELNKLQENQARSAGLAGAAAFELGRTISDLPFGIVAVTNNISQLGTIFAALVANAGGVKAAFSLLLGQLIGPAGVLIAFQAVTAVVTAFANSNRKAKESAEDLTEALLEERLELILLRKELENEALTEQERADIFERQKGAVKDLSKAIKLGLIDREREKEILDEIDAITDRRREKARLDTKNAVENFNIVERIKELEERRAEIEQEREEERRLRLPTLTEAQAAEMELKFKRRIQEVDDKIAQQEERSLVINKESNEISAEIEKTKQRLNNEVSNLVTKHEKEKELKEDIEEIDKRRLQAQRELQEATISVAEKSAEAELEALEKSEVQQLEAKRRLVEKLLFLQLERLDAESREEIKNITDPQTIALIEQKYQKLAELVGMEFAERMQQALKVTKFEVEIQPIVSVEDILDKPQTEAQKFAQKQLEEYADGVMDNLSSFVKSNPKFKKKKEEAEKEFSLQDGLKLAQQSLDSMFGLFDAQFEREIALEQAKTIAINDQLRERLRNEKLTAEQRDEINQQIARNDAELLKKQNEIEKKRFQLNKAAAISNAIINTASAVVAALDDLPVPANFIAAGIVGAAGAAQIATIASQQFVPQESPNPRLSALGTGESSGPSFNVVGSSTRNQLAEAVSSALSDKPVKAYVVSSDVSTAQELDRKIIEGASI